MLEFQIHRLKERSKDNSCYMEDYHPLCWLQGDKTFSFWVDLSRKTRKILQVLNAGFYSRSWEQHSFTESHLLTHLWSVQLLVPQFFLLTVPFSPPFSLTSPCLHPCFSVSFQLHFLVLTITMSQLLFLVFILGFLASKLNRSVPRSPDTLRYLATALLPLLSHPALCHTKLNLILSILDWTSAKQFVEVWPNSERCSLDTSICDRFLLQSKDGLGFLQDVFKSEQ